MEKEKETANRESCLAHAEKLRRDPEVHYNCAQSVLIPFAGSCGISEEKAFQLGSNFGSGMKMGGCCGAITGGLMVIGMCGGSQQQVQTFMSSMRAKHDNLVNCADLLRKNAQEGGDKKTHCDRLVYDAIDSVTTTLGPAYSFYGWQTADVPAVNPDYPKIHTPRDLYDVLLGVWSRQTCAERMRKDWTEENPTLGQCSITAFLAQDIFGGKVCGILNEDGSYHCYNVVKDRCFDLTSEQFGEKAKDLVYENNPEQDRSVHFAMDDKQQRYELLKKGVLEKQYEYHCDPNGYYEPKG